MKYAVRKLVSLILILVLSLGVFPFAVFAESETVTAESVISDIEFRNYRAIVTYKVSESAKLVVALYDDETDKMFDVEVSEVYTSKTKSTVDFDVCLPKEFVVKAFLLDGNNKALCEAYSERVERGLYQDGEYIFFGSYPQTKITDANLLAELNSLSLQWISYGYYIGEGRFGTMVQSDYMKYADIDYYGEKYRAVTFSSYRPNYTYGTTGTYQKDTKYYTDEVYWFRYDPLKWTVLSAEEGLAMTSSIIDSQPFNNTIYKNGSENYKDTEYTAICNNYAQSDIREWLNDDFYNTAFTTTEKRFVTVATLDNSAIDGYSKYDSPSTDDRIFLLSNSEASDTKYFADNSAKKQGGTDYAKCQGLIGNVNTSYHYWRLRTAGSNSYNAIGVSDKGEYYAACATYNTSMGICPAIKLDLTTRVDEDPNDGTSSDEPTEEEIESVEYSFDNCDPREKYVLLNISDCEENYQFTENTLCFIDEVTADENGVVKGSFIPKAYYEDSKTLIFGNGKPYGSSKISKASIEGFTLTIDFTADENAKLIVALYDSKTHQMLDCMQESVGIIDFKRIFTFDKNSLPEEFSVKIFLLDENYRLLCDTYSLSLKQVFCEFDEIITLGMYPQTEVTDSELLADLNSLSLQWTSYGYFSGSGGYGTMKSGDYMKYADVTRNGEKYRAVTFSSYRTNYTYGVSGTFQVNNGYLTDKVYWFKYEPLKWRMIDREKGILLCETIIDSQPYSNVIYQRNNEYYRGTADKIYCNNYMQSDIRKWLNNDFYNTAFTASEKSEIQLSSLNNKAVDGYSEYDSASTEDRLFILSLSDAVNSEYFANASERLKKGSDYAKCQGLFVNTESGNSAWRLRTAGSGSYDTTFVSETGGCDNYCYAEITYVGICPALSVMSKTLVITDTSFENANESDEEMEYSFENCTPDKKYILMNVLSYTEGESVSVNDIYFIDEVTSDEKGTVSGRFLPKTYSKNSKILLFGDSEHREYKVPKLITATCQNGTATVSFTVVKNANIVVAVYDVATNKMLECKVESVSTNDTAKTFTFNSELPEVFWLKAFLLDENNRALCDSYSTIIGQGNTEKVEAVKLGSYPQGEVKDEALLEELNSLRLEWISYGYYSGNNNLGSMTQSDYMKYADVTYNGEKYRAVTFSSCRPYITFATPNGRNSYQTGNGYFTGRVYWFKYEPLKWIVVDSDKGLVLCETIIDSQAYNNTIYENMSEFYKDSDYTVFCNNYANSDIREWLNNDFYNTAFTASDKEYIALANLTTTAPDGYSKYDSEPTEDKVFLLSGNEVLKYTYFPEKESLRAKATDYATCQGLDRYDGRAAWYLRSAGSNSRAVNYVNHFGTLYTTQTYHIDYGIRPAILLNLEMGDLWSALEDKEPIGETAKKIEYSFNNGYPNEKYILMNVNGYSGEFVLSEENLQYIDEVTTDENGTVSGSLIPKTYREDSVTEIFGDYRTCRIVISNPPKEMEMGTAVRLDVEVKHGVGGEKIMFSSSDDSVLVVDENGNVTATGNGKATVTVTVADTDVKSELEITVLPPYFTVTWIIDDKETIMNVREGGKISEPSNPTKTGYSFAGWDKEIPPAMPSENLTFTALWTVNSYEVVWVVDGVETKESYKYGSVINAPETPARIGYTFAGWDKEIPATMPSKPLTFTALWTINSYVITWRIDLVEIKYTYQYGEEVAVLADPKKEGYTFIGWNGGVPVTMPAENIMISAVWEVNSYDVIWVVDGEETKQTYRFGEKIMPPEISVREGYAFLGWNETVPDKMPAKNMRFTALFGENVPTAVRISKMPSKTEYNYKLDDIDISGIELELTYSDGTKKIVKDTSEMKVFDYSKEKRGEQTVTVEYEGLKVNYKVNVKYTWWQWIIVILLFGWIWY